MMLKFIWQTAVGMTDEYFARQPGTGLGPHGRRKIFKGVIAKRLPYDVGPSFFEAVKYCLQIGSLLIKGFAMEFRRSVVQKLDIKRLVAGR